MSTLFLSSSGLRRPIIQAEFLKILPKDASQLKLIYIFTATKAASDNAYDKKDRATILEMGFQFEELDIEGKTEGQLREALTGTDIIYMQGGNGFYLLKHIRLSGFDKILPELLNKGVIYFGTSAGTYVACPTIEMHKWKLKQRDDHGVTDLTGMNLVPFLVAVHYDDTYCDVIKEGMSKTTLSTKIITDDQALLIQNGRVSLVGLGNEVSI